MSTLGWLRSTGARAIQGCREQGAGDLSGGGQSPRALLSRRGTSDPEGGLWRGEGEKNKNTALHNRVLETNKVPWPERRGWAVNHRGAYCGRPIGDSEGGFARRENKQIFARPCLHSRSKQVLFRVIGNKRVLGRVCALRLNANWHEFFQELTRGEVWMLEKLWDSLSGK